MKQYLIKWVNCLQSFPDLRNGNETHLRFERMYQSLINNSDITFTELNSEGLLHLTDDLANLPVSVDYLYSD